MPKNMTVFDVVASTMIKGRDMLNKAWLGLCCSCQSTNGWVREIWAPILLTARERCVYDVCFDVPTGGFDAGLLTTGVAATIARVIFEVTGIQDE